MGEPSCTFLALNEATKGVQRVTTKRPANYRKSTIKPPQSDHKLAERRLSPMPFGTEVGPWDD